uniref:Uncharacterized protein n=1 Tax=Anguilla anguilla TaxID=7936 RepID=A0A0E9PH35_ANGAN
MRQSTQCTSLFFTPLSPIFACSLNSTQCMVNLVYCLSNGT